MSNLLRLQGVEKLRQVAAALQQTKQRRLFGHTGLHIQLHELIQFAHAKQFRVGAVIRGDTGLGWHRQLAERLREIGAHQRLFVVQFIGFDDVGGAIQPGCQRRLHQQLLVDQRVECLLLQLCGRRRAGGLLRQHPADRIHGDFIAIHPCQHLRVFGCGGLAAGAQ